MKTFFYNSLVFLGRLYVALLICLAIVVTIPVWVVLEFIVYMEKVTKIRSQRALTEYID